MAKINAVLLGAVLGCGMLAGLPMAQAAEPAATRPAASDGAPYTLSADPVSGAPLGDNPIIYQHHGRELRFAGQQTLDTFKRDPGKYLPKVDQQMIAQQLPSYPLDTCMVSGDKLGGDMGAPVNIIYKNRLIRFCCKECVKDFNKNPARYLKELDEAAVRKSGTASAPAAGAEHGH